MRPLKHPCVTDQLRRHKEIEEAIGGLKSKIEIEEQKKSLVIKATQDSDDKRQLLNLSIVDLDKVLKELDEVAKIKINSGIELLQDEDKLAESFISFIKKIDITIDEKNKELADIQERAKQVHEGIVIEEKRLVQKKRDIGIYQKRLEKKYKEIYPNRELIV